MLKMRNPGFFFVDTQVLVEKLAFNERFTQAIIYQRNFLPFCQYQCLMFRFKQF